MASDIESLLKKHKINKDNIPEHIAIIMDGNGRWAKKRALPRTFGHKKGHKTLRKILETCGNIGVKYLTVYVFSTENWTRPKDEVSFLMNFLKTVIKEELSDLNKKNVRIRFLGHLDQLDPSIVTEIQNAEESTEKNTKIQLNIMVNYGARQEITQAVQTLLQQTIPAEDITEEQISSVLYTKGIPDPNILIRTGNEYRISNYLLWQIAYTELFFLAVLWPDFSDDDLLSVISEYQSRDRRFGGL